jgi:hypothetical protein
VNPALRHGESGVKGGVVDVLLSGDTGLREHHARRVSSVPSRELRNDTAAAVSDIELTLDHVEA